MKKMYVKVLVEFSKEGKMIPKSIEWEDGRVYEVQKVLDVSRRPSFKVGGFGDRYHIQINNTTTYIFYEDGKWFVEAK